MLLCKDGVDSIAGGGDGVHVWEHDVERLGVDRIGVFLAIGTVYADALNLPVWEPVELEIDELVNLAGRDIGLDGTLDTRE